MFFRKNKKEINFLETEKEKEKKNGGLIKDLFIPHHGNGFLPTALHPKRLLFYTATALIIKIILLAFVIIYPIEAWLTPDIASDESKKLISLTNKLRQEKGLPILHESLVLDRAAYDKNQDMLINQYFDHQSPAKKTVADWLKNINYNYSVAGENLAIGFVNAENVFRSWLASPSHYANLIDPDYKEIGVNITNGTFKGSETSVVAEYFAAPKEAVILASTENKSTKTITKKNTVTNTKKVIAKKKPTKKIATPVIVSPKDKYATAENTVLIKVLSPQAHSLDMFVDGKLLTQVVVKNDGTGEAEVNLDEGLHKITVAANSGEQRVFSANENIIVNTQAPVVDKTKSIINISQSVGSNSFAVKANVFLSQGTEKASISFGDQIIKLQPDKDGSWSGTGIIYQTKTNPTPTTMASISATNEAGQTSLTDITPANIKPATATPIDIYQFVKNHQPSSLKALFTYTTTYYKILLVLAMFTLLLNIFIEIKKQHPHIIASTVGFISLLFILILI